MLTNQVSVLNKEQNDKRDIPNDEELYKGIFKRIIVMLIFKLYKMFFYLDEINPDINGLQFRQPETVVMYQPPKFVNQVI